MNEYGFDSLLFTANEKRIDSLLSFAQSNCDQGAEPCRILDLGCGTGEYSLKATEYFKHADILGIDISHANIERAVSLAKETNCLERTEFITSDYMESELGAFDLIIADSVLHLIPGDTKDLADKLSSNMKKGSVLVLSMPFGCLANHLLWAARKLLRMVRCRLLDAFALRAMIFKFGASYTKQQLEARLEYLYIIPYRYFGSEFRSLLEERGISLLTQTEEEGISGRPKHARIALVRK